jgi:predicted outer membrane repeat protein
VAGDTSIDNTTFRGNQTCTVGGSICHGSGLYGFEVDMTVTNSLFEDNVCNHANCDGGGLYLNSSFVTVTLSLTDTDFVNNTAGRAGGGVVANTFRVNTVVTGGRFEGNQAGIGDGGGMVVYGVVLSGTQFLTNTSGSTQTFDDGGGGLNVQATAVLTNALFQGNHSDRGGGGFAAFLGPVSFHSVTFRNNTADENGGGAYVELLDVTVTDSLFDGNSTLIPEIINDDNVGNGGGLWVGGSLVLNNVDMTNNTATNRGGGLYTPLGASHAVTISGGLIQGNAALGTEIIADGGGGIFLINETLVLNGVQIRDNEALAAGGGGILNFGATADNSSLFQGNRALYGGGDLCGVRSHF